MQKLYEEKNMECERALLSKEKLNHAKLKLKPTKIFMITIRRNYSAKRHNYSKPIIQNPGTTIRTRRS